MRKDILLSQLEGKIKDLQAKFSKLRQTWNSKNEGLTFAERKILKLLEEGAQRSFSLREQINPEVEGFFGVFAFIVFVRVLQDLPTFSTLDSAMNFFEILPTAKLNEFFCVLLSSAIIVDGNIRFKTERLPYVWAYISEFYPNSIGKLAPQRFRD